MVFDKTKAMRNAERFLAQGKIRLAITEYKQVVENDPRDFVTLNLLGDLYTKVSETTLAVKCYMAVAEYYAKQGFDQKAIAVYNKIAKIQPNSPTVTERLAELYRSKGAYAEAKSHYVILAESYQAKGRITEALAIWKQIALLDVNNTEVYESIAEAYLKEGQDSEAADAFSEAGLRFAKKGMHERALEAFHRSLEIDPLGQKALLGCVEESFFLGRQVEVIKRLENLHSKYPANRDLVYLLIDCYLSAGESERAEKTVIKLVEQEPANYPKFLDVARHYIEKSDMDGASRVLSMASEHLLAGGQALEFAEIVRKILAYDPENLEAVRLLVRFVTWQRDENALKDALRQLADLGRKFGCVEDERYALSQLALLMPHESAFAERLREINSAGGFEDIEPTANGLFDQRFYKNGHSSVAAVLDTQSNAAPVSAAIIADSLAQISESDVSLDTGRLDENTGSEAANDFQEPELFELSEIDESPEARLRRECDSIKFYIESGYAELAAKAIEELRAEFGETDEIRELRSLLGGAGALSNAEDSNTNANSGVFNLDEFRSELGLVDDEPEANDSDFDTQYQTAIAYQEMGLLEQAIAGFQEAASKVRPDDGTRRFFHCANLLGHCFMQNGMPKLATRWYQRALETPNLGTEEKLALWYELGVAAEADNDYEAANRYFEQVYAEDVDFRDVGDRLKNLIAAR
jgi:tetratricopeptide (TPR) repeat protein